MEKNLTSIDIERILTEYEEELFIREEMEDEESELEGLEGLEVSEPETDTRTIEHIIASVLRHKVAVLKNKDYYAAKLMQLFKLTVLLLDDGYHMDEKIRKSCIQYLLDELREDLTDVIQIIDALPDLRTRHNPS